MDRHPPPFLAPFSLPSMRPLRPPAPAGRPSHLARKTSRVLLLLFYVASTLIFALAIWQIIITHAENHIIAYCIAGFAVAIAIPLSLYDVNSHLQNYVSPLQRHYIRILGLVPFFAVQSWLALVFKEQHLILATVREWYEAFVIYAFFHLCVEWLGGTGQVTAYLAERDATARLDFARMLANEAGGGAALPQGRPAPAAVSPLPSPPPPAPPLLHHTKHVTRFSAPRKCMPLPFCCLRPWRMDSSGQYMRFTTWGVEQYVVLRALLAVVTLCAEWGGALCEGQWMSPSRCAYPYTAGILNCSQFTAMYCLFVSFAVPNAAARFVLAGPSQPSPQLFSPNPHAQLFYHDLWHELEPLHPFWKIACIKLLVMATFWQGIIISLLASEGQVRSTETYSQAELQNSLQDFLICLEMAVFAVAHHYVMGAAEFKSGSSVLEHAVAPRGAGSGTLAPRGGAAPLEGGAREGGAGRGPGTALTMAVASRSWGGGREGAGRSAQFGAAERAP